MSSVIVVIGAGSISQAIVRRVSAGVVIASQSRHRLPGLGAEQNAALATTPVEQLLALRAPLIKL